MFMFTSKTTVFVHATIFAILACLTIHYFGEALTYPLWALYGLDAFIGLLHYSKNRPK